MRRNSIRRGRSGSRWNGGRRQRRNRHEAMRRAVASGQNKRDHEWADMAAVLEAMSSAVGRYGRHSRGATGRLCSGRSGASAGQGTSIGSSKTVAQCNAEYAANKAAIRASGQTKRDFVAACRAGPKRSGRGLQVRPLPVLLLLSLRRVLYSRGNSRPRRLLRLRLRPTAPHRQRPRRCFRICATGSIPLPRSDRGLGQRKLAHLPLRRNARLRKHKARRVHVRGRRPAAGNRAAKNESHP